MSDYHGPLSRFTVLDLTRVRSGPTCVRQLADWGANVIKIEAPEAIDKSKGMGGARSGPDFQNLHRNKRAITLNMKEPKGVELFMKMVETADVVVENFSVGVTERLGIDYGSLSKLNRSLIYCSVTGYGSTGPDARLKGYDAVAQAASGLMNLTGFSDNPPVKAGSALADSIGGVFGFGGIMAALYHRERSGQGQHVDISMVDCLFSLVFDEPLDCYEQLGLPPRMGNRIMRLSPFNSYLTEDGWIIIATGTTAQWHTLLRAIEREDLIQTGWIGFLQGLKSYDPDVKVKLSTHLHVRIEGEITHGLEQSDDMGLRHKKYWVVQRVRRGFNEMYQMNGINPSPEDLAEHLGMEPDVVEDLLIASANTDAVSLDEPRLVMHGEGHNLHDVVPDDGTDIETQVELGIAMDALTENQLSVVQRHVYEGMTFQEIGDADGIAKQNAKKTYDRAIARMRKELA